MIGQCWINVIEHSISIHFDLGFSFGFDPVRPHNEVNAFAYDTHV
jgi:hypothetical protein